MDRQIEVGRNGTAGAAHGFAVKGVHHRACRTHVLLGPSVDEVIGIGVECARENVRTHVGDQRNTGFGCARELGAENGVVRGVMQIARVRARGLKRGDAIVIGFLGRAYHIDGAKVFGFLDGFRRPRAGVNVCGFSSLRQQVCGCRVKSKARSTL